MTPESTLLLAWLDEADAPQWVVDGVADALPKIEASQLTAVARAARRFVAAWDAYGDLTFEDADGCYDRALDVKLEQEHDEALQALRAVLGMPDLSGIGSGPAPHGGEGSIRIWLERKRQATEEGYDDEHDAGQGWALARAGVAYAIAGTGVAGDLEADGEAFSWWPWSWAAWKPSDDDLVRNLVKAGALIAAAIDAHLLNPGSAPVPDPGLAMEDAIETASDGGEL